MSSRNSDNMALQDVIEKHSKTVGTTYSGRSYHAVQHIIRSLDYVFPLYYKSDVLADNKVEEFREFFMLGWVTLLKKYYGDIDVNTLEPFPLMTDEAINWAYSNIIYSGKIEFCKQLISLEKAGLIQIICTNQNEYTFKYLNEKIGLERFDVNSYTFYKEKIVEQFISEKKKKKPLDKQKIISEFKKQIKNPDGELISYTTTPEIDDYYQAEGHYHVLRIQGYDDFDEGDTFGGISYKKYVDIIEMIVGVALKHLDACLELKLMNKNVNLHNLLTYTFFKDKTIEAYADYSGFDIEEVKQIISCVTLSKENFDYYLEYPGSPPPMYFHVSENILIRSIAGCLSNPFSLLNRELKRKYKKDYDKALNNRENRFRDQLFSLLPNERIVKIPKEINIAFRGMKTDIDAIAFDTKTGTLGLFQLKWQDPFAKSMKERYSRISNLFPKANEWIEKMRFWVFNNRYETIINSLQIDKYYKGRTPINDICVFIIARNAINFTGIENKDETVAWSSWYQLIEAQARIKTSFDDPIKEMFVKIKSFDPRIRLEKEEQHSLSDIEVYIGETKIYYKK